MVVELREKSQITIPKYVVTEIGASRGDKFEVIPDENGGIKLIPVAIYPKGYVELLEKEVKATKKDMASGKKPTFSSVDKMFDYMESH